MGLDAARYTASAVLLYLFLIGFSIQSMNGLSALQKKIMYENELKTLENLTHTKNVQDVWSGGISLSKALKKMEKSVKSNGNVHTVITHGGKRKLNSRG